MIKNWKFYCLKSALKNYNFPFSRPLRTSKIQKKHSAQRTSTVGLQNMKFLDFLLLLWVIFALLDPDPKHCFDVI
jgi:hypothetical protein